MVADKKNIKSVTVAYQTQYRFAYGLLFSSCMIILGMWFIYPYIIFSH